MNDQPEVVVVADADAAARTAAERIAAILADAVAAARPRRLGDDRRVVGRRHLPTARRRAASGCRPVAGGPRLVGRRSLRPARPPAVQRQAARRHPARDRTDRGGRGRWPRAGHSAAGGQPPPLPDERGDRRQPRPGLVRGVARRRTDAVNGLPTDGSWPILRPGPARHGRRRARAVGLPGVGRARRRRACPGHPGTDARRAARRAGHPQPGGDRRRPIGPRGRHRRRKGDRSWPRCSAGLATRRAGRRSSPGERGPPGSSTPRPRRASAADRYARSVAERRLGRRDAHRGVHERRRPAAGPGPRRLRRPHDLPGHRSTPGGLVHRPRDRPARPRCLGRHRRTRSSASSRTSSRSPGCSPAETGATGSRARPLVRRAVRARRGAPKRPDRPRRLLRGRAGAGRQRLPTARPAPRPRAHLAAGDLDGLLGGS